MSHVTDVLNGTVQVVEDGYISCLVKATRRHQLKSIRAKSHVGRRQNHIMRRHSRGYGKRHPNKRHY